MSETKDRPPPAKKPRVHLHPSQHATASQSAALNTLFTRHIDKPVNIPVSATRAPKTTANLAPPPEIVANVQGSSAGAGSGEFHVYKASRRREYERVRLMEEEADREDKDREWKEKQIELAKKDEEKTARNAKRRRKGKKGKGGDANGAGKESEEKKMDNKGGKADDAEEQYQVTAGVAAESNGLVIHDED